MLKLKLQYFGHLMQRTDSVENTLMLVKIEGRRRRGQQRMRWLDGWMADYIMQNARMDETQMESRLLGEISTTSDTQMKPPLWLKVEKN